MPESNQSAERNHPATDKKLATSRAEGDVTRSMEVVLFGTYASFLLLFMIGGGALISGMAQVLQILLDRPDRIDIRAFAPTSENWAANPVVAACFYASFFIAVPFLAAVAALALQRAIVFVPSKLLPKLNRISPASAIKNRYGVGGLVEFFISVTKLVLVSLLTGLVLARHFESIGALTGGAPQTFVIVCSQIFTAFATCLVALSAIIAGADYLWQRFSRSTRLRMSISELRQEAKESDGDPHIKGQRQRRAAEIASNRMMLDVPKADVVIVNPTHYAVALTWKRDSKNAPVCVAKGIDAVATRIRETASAAGVPIHQDAATARSLHALVEIGQEIRTSHYRPVAAAIRFSEKMRKVARQRQQP